VPLDLDLSCNCSRLVRRQVNDALLDVLSNRTRADGTRGCSTLTVSRSAGRSTEPVLASAQAVAGVLSVRATGFGRWGEPTR